MSAPVLADLEREINEAKSVMESATVLINGFQARLDAAVQSALDSGATAAQLEPFTSLSQELSNNTDALSAAVVANTPSA